MLSDFMRVIAVGHFFLASADFSLHLNMSRRDGLAADASDTKEKLLSKLDLAACDHPCISVPGGSIFPSAVALLP